MHHRVCFDNGLGRPRTENPLHRVSIRMEQKYIDWVRQNGGSVVIRELLKEAMEMEASNTPTTEAE